MTGVTRKLAEFVDELSYEVTVPDTVIERTKLLILDITGINDPDFRHD